MIDASASDLLQVGKMFRRAGFLAPVVMLLLWSAAGRGAWAAPRSSAPEVEVASWTVQDGMPGDSVTSIQQTDEGFLWVGTTGGLARFDGRTFSPVAVEPVAGSGTNSPAITAQAVDASQQLWFGADRKGLYRLTTRFGRLTAQVAGLEDERVQCLGADESGALWIGTDKGLVRQQEGRFVRIPLDLGVANPEVIGLQVTRSNGIWLTTQAGLRKYQDGRVEKGEFDPEQKTPFLGVFEDRAGSLWGFGDTYLLNLSENRRFNYFRGGGATQLQVWSICEGRAGQLWIGTSGQGLFYFAGIRFHAVNLQEGSGHSGVRTVFADRDGQIWVGTQRGLLRLRERVVRWHAGPGSAATSLCEDRDGKVWAGFEHGGLISGKEGSLEKPGTATPWTAQNLISSLHARPDGSLWVGTLGTGLYRAKEGRTMHYTLAHGLSDETVVAVCGGLAGRVWVSTADGRMHRFLEHLAASYDQRHGLTGNPVTAMIRASAGGLWLGTSKGELLRYATEVFKPVPVPAEWQGKRLMVLKEFGPNVLWAGSYGGGLGRFENNKWEVWNTGNGLPSNHVLGIEQSESGEVWVGTSLGAFRLPESSKTEGGVARAHVLVEFPPEKGEESFGWPRSLRSHDGLLWFATAGGVVSFDPDDLRVRTAAPWVFIETVRSNNGRIEHGLASIKDGERKLLKLPSGLRDVEFGFTAAALARPERTRFRHRLEGFDSDWVDSTMTRSARYGRLPPGQYEFRVMASDAEGGWTGRETRLQMQVLQPVWKRPWAVALGLVTLLTLVVSLVRVISHRRLRRQLLQAEQQRAMERERSRIAQDMHDELGAKLTKISFLSERARNDLAASAVTSSKLDSIALTSRELLHSLDEIVWAVNPKNDTLENLAAYLGQYAVEYFQNTAMEHELSIPGKLPECVLRAEVRHNLFLAFEESLGNALKHSGATQVRISMAVERGAFTIQITDNGRGFSTEGDTTGTQPVSSKRRGAGGSGLRGMRERLAQSGGQCELRTEPGSGTTIRLSIPLDICEK